MRKQTLVEYTLTPEELDEAVLEFISRKETGKIANTAKLRYVRYQFPSVAAGGKRKHLAPIATALTELPDAKEFE